MKILNIINFSRDLSKSLLLHIVLILILGFSFSSTPSTKAIAPQHTSKVLDIKSEPSKLPKKIISAGLVDKKLIDQAQSRQKQAEFLRKQQLINESKRLAEAKQSLKKLKQKQTETNKNIAQAQSEIERAKELAKKERERAQKNKELAEKAKQQELLAKQQAELESKKLLEQQEKAQQLAEKIASEKKAARNAWLDNEFARFVGQVKYNVLARRSLTFAFDKNLVCEIQIKLTSDGDIVDARVVKSSGNPAYDNNSKTAVLKAAPFKMPEDAELNQRVREIRLSFRQDEQ